MRRTWMISVVGIGLAWGAAAQGQEAPPARQDKAPLKGPEVRQNRPATNEPFSESAKRRERDGIPMRAYAEILGRMKSDAAATSIRLSADQEQKIAAIEREFREATRAFGERVREGTKRANRSDPNAPGEMQMDEARREEMRREAPRPGDYQTRIWALLNPAQRQFVQAEVERARQELVKQRTEQEAQKRLAQRQAGTEPAKPSAGARPAAPSGDAAVQPAARERARRIVERLAQLPPDERERILARLEAELDRRLALPAAGDQTQPRRRPQAKPAPDMSDVTVPWP
ncbi:MAG: hypothetical protein JNM80_09765 [Phycisphaerae bacterium]|nr:hypothetical protein [Phycisphaerae bacterium]